MVSSCGQCNCQKS